ncbi:hypothetical protein SAMN05444339_101953 [Loktanella atrilutea]|uniref:Uncharacterized protein n=1 Tax=Loktanella atrilutea TaxID=366533 RepID=A0A1M4V5B2_LOKAT|nr:hypothetical protein [Loktanella atrilutea]SHE64135.1 hypothetical protein SAMN05444339_101953 [Loktanella atrilutea]
MLKTFLFPMALLGHAASADVCQSTVESIALQIDTETLTVSPAPTTRRERLLNFPARSFDWLTGDQRSCTSEEVFAFISEIEPVDDMCLQYTDAETGFVLVPGARNFRGRCTGGGVCTKVNGTKDALTHATGAVVGTVLGTGDSTLSKVTHSSGAVLLSGSHASITSALGTAATSAAGVVSAPVAIGAAAATAVAVGGAVWVCSE